MASCRISIMPSFGRAFFISSISEFYMAQFVCIISGVVKLILVVYAIGMAGYAHMQIGRCPKAINPQRGSINHG